MFISGRGRAAIIYFVGRTLVTFLSLSVVLNSIKCETEEVLPKTWNADRLRFQLFTNYDKNLHPMMNEDNRTVVSIGLLLDYIDVSEHQGQMILHGWLSLNWWDMDRVWNPSAFENLKLLSLRSSEIWTPDINLYQSSSDEKHSQLLGEAPVILTHDGSLRWVPPVVCIAYCQLNLRQWPYDEQQCRLRIGLWDFSRMEASSFNERAHGLSASIKSAAWDITSVHWQQKNDSDSQHFIEYRFGLMRRSSVYRAVVITPIASLILLSLCSFWVPAYMGEKLLLNAIVVILNTAFLLYFTQLLPTAVAENTPLIVHFYSCSLLLLSLSTAEAVVVLYLSTVRHKLPLPHTIRVILSGCLGRFLLITQFTHNEEQKRDGELQFEVSSRNRRQVLLKDAEDFPTSPNYVSDGNHCLNHCMEEETNEGDMDISQNQDRRDQQQSVQIDWILLALAVDRLSFIVFSLIYILLIVVYAY